MSATYAALGEFGDAISFIFSERENQRARQHPDDLREQRPHESCTSTAPGGSARAGVNTPAREA